MAAHAMAEQRLFVANNLDAARDVTLSHAQTHYLLHVLRLTEGAHLLVFDGRNGEWRAQIVAAKKSGCAIRLIEKVREQTAAQDIHYAFAPLKQGRLDYMVQKAVEMGASLLQPVMTAHTSCMEAGPAPGHCLVGFHLATEERPRFQRRSCACARVLARTVQL